MERRIESTRPGGTSFPLQQKDFPTAIAANRRRCVGAVAGIVSAGGSRTGLPQRLVPLRHSATPFPALGPRLLVADLVSDGPAVHEQARASPCPEDSEETSDDSANGFGFPGMAATAAVVYPLA